MPVRRLFFVLIAVATVASGCSHAGTAPQVLSPAEGAVDEVGLPEPEGALWDEPFDPATTPLAGGGDPGSPRVGCRKP